MNRYFRCSIRAFSLVELLLALAVFSVVALTLYSVFFAGLEVQQRALDDDETYRQMSLALDVMARDLENAVPYNFGASYPQFKAFQGFSDRVIFLHATGRGLKVVSLQLRPQILGEKHQVQVRYQEANEKFEQTTSVDAQNMELVRTQQEFLDYLNGLESGDSVILCRGLKAQGLDFSYGALNPDSGERSWRSAWNFNSIPAFIKIRLISAGRGGSRQDIILEKKVLNPSGTTIVQ